MLLSVTLLFFGFPVLPYCCVMFFSQSYPLGFPVTVLCLAFMCGHVCTMAAKINHFLLGRIWPATSIHYLTDTVRNITNPETILMCCIYTTSQYIRPLSSHCKKSATFFMLTQKVFYLFPGRDLISFKNRILSLIWDQNCMKKAKLSMEKWKLKLIRSGKMSVLN